MVSRRSTEEQVIESGAFELMPDNRMAIGTRRGDIYFMSGVDDDKPRPRFENLPKGSMKFSGSPIARARRIPCT